MHGRVCAYCQRVLSDSDRGDVEHFRPKSVYVWLIYEFNNYFLGCRKCNSRLKGSKFDYVAELCDSMHTVVAHILECPMSPEVRDIDLLQNLGNAIARSFQADGNEIAIAHAITDSLKVVA